MRTVVFTELANILKQVTGFVCTVVFTELTFSQVTVFTLVVVVYA